MGPTKWSSITRLWGSISRPPIRLYVCIAQGGETVMPVVLLFRLETPGTHGALQFEGETPYKYGILQVVLLCRGETFINMGLA